MKRTVFDGAEHPVADLVAASSAVPERARVLSPVWPPAVISADRPVSGLNTGLMQFTRMFSGPSSAASDLLVVITAPLEPLYQLRPGRGRTPAVDAMLMNEPPLLARNAGTAWRVDR